jgi:L-lactate dehydrogenase complex protein LldG
MSGGAGSAAARGAMLARIRAARAGAALVEPARDYRTHGEHGPGSAALLDLLEDRLVDYRAAVRRSDSTGLRGAVRGALTAAGADGRVLLPPGLPADWAPAGQVDDGLLSPVDLDGFAAVVTACRVACAETGTIVLDGAADQGRRAITLVPDIHVCVVRAEQVVQSVPEMMARLEATRPITFVSGPSATSDIELDRVEGVHGPRTLSVVLVG